MEQEQCILLVDDEEDILEFLGYNLKKEGYQVLTATNGQKAVQLAVENRPDLIILDVMMPGMDGVETCNLMRQHQQLKDTMIIFLTARSEDYSQIAGFEAGGDDYLAKPIRPKVFVSRVRALLKRTRPVERNSDSTEVANLVIDREKYTVFVDGREVNLPRKEFELLSLLASKPNKVFTRDEIFDKIWGNNVIVGDRTIDVHIRKLREKIGIPNIKTVKGVGYKFEEK
jgi:two-component system, OmpR family, alkaline phosphatase synthesis response regulator PhoP